MKEPSLEYRLNEWADLKSNQPAFGIQKRVRHGTKFKWRHLACNDSALIYRTKEIAQSNVNWLNSPTKNEPDWTCGLAYDP